MNNENILDVTDTHSSSEEENEYTVDYWRKQFKIIRPQLKRNWHRQLADFDATLDSLKGANDMRAVAHGKASITVTQRIVSIAEKMLDEKPAKQRKTRTLAERLMRGEKWKQTYWKNRGVVYVPETFI